MSGNYVIVANVMAADSCLRLGARVVVLSIPGNPAHVFVKGLSRSGRVIRKWTMRHRLHNFRAVWTFKPEWSAFETKESAEREIAARFGSPCTPTVPHAPNPANAVDAADSQKRPIKWCPGTESNR